MTQEHKKKELPVELSLVGGPSLRIKKWRVGASFMQVAAFSMIISLLIQALAILVDTPQGLQGLLVRVGLALPVVATTAYALNTLQGKEVNWKTRQLTILKGLGTGIVWGIVFIVLMMYAHPIPLAS